METIEQPIAEVEPKGRSNDGSRGAGREGLWRDVAVAFSFSTFAYMKVWVGLATRDPNNLYLMKTPPGAEHYAAAAVNVLFLTALLAAAVRWARRRTNRRWAQFARLTFFGGFAILFNSTRDVALRPVMLRFQALSWSVAGGWPVAAAVGIVTFAALSYLVLRFRLLRVPTIVLLLLSPFGVFKAAQLAWQRMELPQTVFEDRKSASRSSWAPGQKRVVWVIFDEWDHALTFENAAAGLELPELTRLRGEGLFADQAYPPAGETQSSLPSLINGRIVREAKATRPDDLELMYAGASQFVPWSRETTIFSEARASGLNTGIVGWAHPYCRILGDSTASCHWRDVGVPHASTGTSFGEVLVNQSRTLVETFNLSPFGQTLNTIQHKNAYVELMDWATQAAADPGLSLVMIHLPTPHPPFFYDRRRRDYSLRQSPIAGYYGALELVDRSVGELRSAVEKAGLWTNTSLLLSADHGCRFANRLGAGSTGQHIPFLLRLAGNDRSFRYTKPFNTVLSKDLVLKLLTGGEWSLPSLAGWISSRTASDSSAATSASAQ